jgi:hypothetical protein
MVVNIFILTGFNVTQMRLTGGIDQHEGGVELLINGRNESKRSAENLFESAGA